MKNLVEFMNESLQEEAQIQSQEEQLNEGEESIKDEKSFRDYAENKFKEVFGDELDEDEMKETIDGILKDYEKEAEEGDWGVLVGVLNKSFAS
jgi:type I restriction-modification system DNA methylase subunit